MAKTVLFNLNYYGFASNLPFTLAVKRWFHLSGKLNASIKKNFFLKRKEKKGGEKHFPRAHNPLCYP